MHPEIEGGPVEVQNDNDGQDAQSSVMGRKNQPSPDHFYNTRITGGSMAPHIPEHMLPKGIRPTEHTPAFFDSKGIEVTIIDSPAEAKPQDKVLNERASKTQTFD